MVQIIAQKQSGGGMIKDILRRLYTAIFFSGIVIGGIVWHEMSYYLLFFLICFFCAFEFFRIVYQNKRDLRFWAAVITTCIPIGIAIKTRSGVFDISAELLIGIASVWIFILIASELWSSRENPVRATAYNMFALAYIGMPCYFAVEAGYLGGTFSYLPLLGIIVLIWANDTGAYLIGSMLGKRPLFFTVSPKKTIEGTLGGVLFTAVLAWPMSLLNDAYSYAGWLGVALIIGIVGTTGDLVESKFKRYYNIKDTGNILPGHGGFMDRFDSFLFIMPFVYLYSKLI